MLNFSNSILGTAKFHTNWEPGMEQWQLLDSSKIFTWWSLPWYTSAWTTWDLHSKPKTNARDAAFNPWRPQPPSEAEKVSGLRGCSLRRVQGVLAPMEREVLRLPHLPSVSLSRLYQPAKPPLPLKENTLSLFALLICSIFTAPLRL